MTARNKIRTFSGTHEFDPTVLVDTNAHECDRDMSRF